MGAFHGRGFVLPMLGKADLVGPYIQGAHVKGLLSGGLMSDTRQRRQPFVDFLWRWRNRAVT